MSRQSRGHVAALQARKAARGKAAYNLVIIIITELENEDIGDGFSLPVTE